MTMTMAKQRRTFFVDDILHMVMPREKPLLNNELSEQQKRKRSINSDDEDTGEIEGSVPEENSINIHTNNSSNNSSSMNNHNKKFRSFHSNDHSSHGSKSSPIVDVLGNGDESSLSDDDDGDDEHSSVGNNSGQFLFSSLIDY